MQIPLNFMGHDFIAEIDWTLTSFGTPARFYGPLEDCDPGSDPEWSINAIFLYEDRPKGYGPAFRATGKLFQTLAALRQIDDAILSYISDLGCDEGFYYDEDYYREER